MQSYFLGRLIGLSRFVLSLRLKCRTCLILDSSFFKNFRHVIFEQDLRGRN